MELKEGIEEVSANRFQEKINDSLTVVDFFAGWHMPCLMFSPVVEEMAKKFSNIDFARVNVDDCNKISKKFDVSSFPTLIVFDKGKEIKRICGNLPPEELEEKLKKILK